MTVGGPLGIAGVGLIGGSIALRARSLGVEVIGFDRDPGSQTLVDAAAASLEELAARSRTLVIALPIDATLAAIDRLRAMPAPQLALAMDVASVKEPVVRHAAGWSCFVATHPIAGAERGGFSSANAGLFTGRAWAYAPADAARDQHAIAFIRAMGANPIPVEPAAHDRTLALTSHLPQVVVSQLAAMLEERRVSPSLAGPGLASTLRLAGSPWALWETILRANGHAVGEALRELGERCISIADALEAGEVDRLASTFEGANRAYERLVRDPSAE